jgi:hypothetical protein
VPVGFVEPVNCEGAGGVGEMVAVKVTDVFTASVEGKAATVVVVASALTV